MLVARFVIVLFVAAVAYIMLLIGPAWWLTDSLDWPRGWLAIGALWSAKLISGLWLLRVDPALLEKRMSLTAKNPVADKLATALIGVLLCGWFVATAFDVHQFQLLPALPGHVSLLIGLVLFVLGMALIMWAMLENTFAVSVVEVQADRQQTLIDTGPYAYIRHPMYSGIILAFMGLGLVCESTALALAGVPMVMLGFLPRILIEEATLRDGLAGYLEYLARVRWRLIPGIY
ncbi:MAG: isoprenylcysteine carboxylmethyltransferase family protein [Rhodospirillaceae bacterium]|jgi:protein-S-isoprenylcysteine O-methyltransferase Ste14|nr:isoprenylcysteine carboxylmethyltransferase family protein [Rhodospirillaceae bacterium]MBT4043197.1 isoprenylcysteine carboxylmethyltransferase family protein [Rhodospirillaceae bacterium]MBT4686972.1 isoprenylcysteine carboxylmethyltransferase family protein [Rhodospirillaceae bacterium]MBT5081782.1 isoprenylcysteine carboxylmethyltransferase family protein [Rhodospirillaceae bacterium]MBT5525470.1 isoprenylcysteine carboxylmethyltransferase family protein [Rhodospirillaceae bacterium]